MLFSQLPRAEFLCASAAILDLTHALQKVGDRFCYSSAYKDAPMTCRVVSEERHPDAIWISPQYTARGIVNQLKEMELHERIRYPDKAAIDTGLVKGWEICLIRFDDVQAALIKAAWIS